MIAGRGARVTLPERLFHLTDPTAVDHLLDRVAHVAVFKAATSEKTFDAWSQVQRVLEPRIDVAVGLVQIPAGRSASDHIATRAGVAHRSPQLLLFHRGQAVAHLDERAIQLDALAAVLAAHLPASPGPRVVNEAVISTDPYRSLLQQFVDGTLPEDRFQWAYLDRLARESSWRDEDTFGELISLFDYPRDRAFTPARVVAHEFQGQLAGRAQPLQDRAARLLTQMSHR